MSKLYRTSRAPAGAELPLRNTRLYGGKDEQIATAALRARGCPSPDRAYVPARSRQSLAAQLEREAHARRLQSAQTRMLTAQRAVREAKIYGRPTAELAAQARDARAAYLRLTGGTDRRTVDASTGADGTKV
jgi:hypothetical protein